MRYATFMRYVRITCQGDMLIKRSLWHDAGWEKAWYIKNNLFVIIGVN